MVRGKEHSIAITALALHVVRSAPVAAVYAGLVFVFNGGTAGVVGIYIVFVAGLVGWMLPALHKWEGIITLAGLAIAGVFHAVASLWVHPILAVSVFLAAGNMLLNTPDEQSPYDEIGRKYWPESLLLVPVGVVGFLALCPIAMVSIPIDLISWVQNLGESMNESKQSEGEADPTTANRSRPQQELETTQRSGRTVEDINTRRPNDEDQ